MAVAIMSTSNCCFTVMVYGALWFFYACHMASPLATGDLTLLATNRLANC